ncbi:MAG TPA: cytochrome c, partial [Trueperaceae bacterium]|nr:cytochrome c [Trueperaceae bacterium]
MSRLGALAALVLVVASFAALVRAQGTPIDRVDTSGGKALFDANCVACHQVTGAGIPAVFPPLRGHAPALVTVEGGRRYLVDVVLFGLSGRIVVEGHQYDGIMPPWGHLSDSQLADVLNYVVTAWDNDQLLEQGFVAYTPEEVLGVRLDAYDSTAVHGARTLLE